MTHVTHTSFLRLIPTCIDWRKICWLFLLLVFASCSHYYYGPNSNNTPLLRDNEAKINFQYARADEFKAAEFQSAFAITNHIGAMANGLYGSGVNNRTYSSSNSSGGKGKFAEVAAGYFTTINSPTTIFEVYGGIGTGGIDNIYSWSDRSKVTFTKLFIQPDIGISVKGFEIALSSKFSRIHHKVVSANHADQHSGLIALREHPVSFLWEPSIVLRAGGKNVLVQVQYTWSHNLSNSHLQQEPGIFSIGLSFPIKYTIPDGK